MKKNQIITLLFLLSAFLSFAQVDGNTKLEVRNDSLIISYKIDLSGLSVGNGLVQEYASTKTLIKEDAWKVFRNRSTSDVIYTIPNQANGGFTEDIGYTFWTGSTGKIFVKGEAGAGVSPREVSDLERYVTLTRMGSDQWDWSSGTLPWTPPTPIDLPSLIVKLTPESIDPLAVNEGDPIGVWIDLKNGYNATSAGVSRPTLHLQGGKKQVRFTSTNGSFLTFGDISALNLIPQTDEYTIIIKIGETITTGVVQDLLSKRQLAATTYQIRIGNSASAASVSFGNGVTGGGPHWISQQVISTVVRTDGYDLYRDNFKNVNNNAVGSSTTTNNMIIGSAYQGASSNLNGDLTHLLIYSEALTEQQLTDIYNHLIND